MAPAAVSPGVQDVDLTSSAIERKLDALPVKNGSAVGVSADANGKKVSQPAELDASKLVFTRNTNPRAVPSEAVANSGTETICTDHMITATWNATTGWAAPELKPYGPLSLMPTASVLHYATECFEGLKCYRGEDGRLRLFRPSLNAARMLMSTLRISLPAFPPAELEKLLHALLAVDGPKWLPRDRPGSFLYIRPTMIGTQPGPRLGRRLRLRQGRRQLRPLPGRHRRGAQARLRPDPLALRRGPALHRGRRQQLLRRLEEQAGPLQD
ncbi:hypothetical protein VDGD_01845 [Verticillium dahliae]|nr:hypothetical protein VDGD_01845 [Verticillium dahliae]